MTYRTFFTATNNADLQLFKDVFGDNIHQTTHDEDDLYYITADDQYSVFEQMYENDLVGYDFGTTIEAGTYSIVREFDGEYEIYGTHTDADKAAALFDQCMYCCSYDTVVLVDDEYLVINQATNE